MDYPFLRCKIAPFIKYAQALYLLPLDIQNFAYFTNTAYYDKPLIMTIWLGPDGVILSGFHCNEKVAYGRVKNKSFYQTF